MVFYRTKLDSLLKKIFFSKLYQENLELQGLQQQAQDLVK